MLAMLAIYDTLSGLFCVMVLGDQYLLLAGKEDAIVEGLVGAGIRAAENLRTTQKDVACSRKKGFRLTVRQPDNGNVLRSALIGF
jgi:hypothetical protein